MIVRILSRGKSFKGCAAYLTHDADQAKTSERVAWTHTLNCANDDVNCAVNEMVWTARDAELLKQEAGIRAGGRATESSVKHFSLNWSPEENPEREQMIEAAQQFLRHMGWQEHQAILVAHSDKDYRHVHGMLNMIHPETGLRLNDDFERRRAQAFALEYEREHGRIFCEERLKTAESREKSMPRNIWTEFSGNEKEFSRAEKSLRENTPNSENEPENRENAEWRILKEMQRDERKEFFAHGKIAFSALRLSIYREVREEFRERWSEFYAAKRNGTDPDNLATMKADLVAEQKRVLDGRREPACQELRDARDKQYRSVLDQQRDMRAELRWRQDLGLDNADFFAQAKESNGVRAMFRDAAREVTARPREGNAHPDVPALEPKNASGAQQTGRADDGIGLRVGVGLGSFLDSLFTDLINLGSARPEPETRSPGPDPFEASADAAQKQQRAREEEDAERQRRERSVPWG